MLISEMQDTSEKMEVSADSTIANLTKRFKSGQIQESVYHSQLTIVYATNFMVEEYRQHAAQVPDTATDNPKAEVCVSLARMLVHENKIPEAIEQYKKALVYDIAHEVAVEEIGRCYYHHKNFADAEKWLLKAAEETDYLESIWEELEPAASHQQKYRVAIRYFEKAKALQTEPDNDYYYEYLMGLCYANLGDFYRALAHYTKCLDANPVYGHALNNMATLYFEPEADIKTAIGYLKKSGSGCRGTGRLFTAAAGLH